MRVVLVDDRQAIRVGVRQMLMSHPDIQVLDMAAEFPSVRDRILALNPDVVIVGELDHDHDPIKSVQQLIADSQEKECRILLLRDVKTQGEALQIMTAGACGYVPSQADESQVASALVIVSGGGQVMLPKLIVRGPLFAGDEPAPDSVGLTERESSVLSALGRGLSNSEIAKELIMSEATVKKHLSSVMRKIGQRNRLRAALYAYRHGIGGLLMRDRLQDGATSSR